MTSASGDEWAGTQQHPDAKDLSEYLIHMTTSEANLVSIVTHGVIEARNPFGVGLYREALVGGQKSACFTEMPVSELHRMTSRSRSYGIAFSKERLRERAGAQPVWYLSDPSPQLAGVRDLMSASASAADSIWKLTPFIDVARVGTATTGPHDWRWEREWRVVGDFHFDIEDIAAILIPKPDGEFEPITEIEFGAPYFDSDGGSYWADGFVSATDAAMELFMNQFHEEWSNAYNWRTYDREDDRWIEYAQVYGVDDAVEYQFDNLPWQVQRALADALTQESLEWVREEELAWDHEDMVEAASGGTPPDDPTTPSGV